MLKKIMSLIAILLNLILIVNANSTACFSDKNVNFFIDETVQGFPSMEGHASASTFQLITHGQPGTLWIAGKWRNAEEISEWLTQQQYLATKTHLNIYGCEFAKGEKGQAAVTYLENTLNITVAASDDITGIDGDWELEIGTPLSNIKLSNYSHNLQQATLPLQQGQVVFTCDCTNDFSPVFAMMDISCPMDNGATTGPSPDVAAYWDDPVATKNSLPSWNCGILGTVSPLATDEELGIGVENIYLGAQGMEYNNRTTLTSLVPNPTGAEVICIDGITGAPRVVTSLPGNTYNVGANTWYSTGNIYSPGIAQVAYNSDTEVIYASNANDGIIYVIDPATSAVIGTYDHGVIVKNIADNPNAAMTLMERYVGAVQYNPCDGYLYYGSQSNLETDDWGRQGSDGCFGGNDLEESSFTLEVWKVQLDAAGVPTGSPTLFDSWDNAFYECTFGSPVIYDMAFTSEDCANQRMMIATKGMFEATDPAVPDNWVLTGPHIGDQREWTFSGGAWDLNESHITIGYYDNDARGLDYGSNLYSMCTADACSTEDSRVTLTDRISVELCPNGGDCPSYGFTITPFSYTTGTGFPAPYPDYTQLYAVDIDGNFTDGFQDKNAYYDLEFLSTPTCPGLEATVSNDQFKCLGAAFDPMEVTPISPSTGLTYQWQMSTTSCAEGFTDVPGATSATYTPPTVLAADTVYYRAVVFWPADCADIGNCERFSDCITIGTFTLSGPDKDGDGIPDEFDADVDNDGIPDKIEQLGLISLATPGVNGEPSPNDICATSPQQLTYNINVPGTNTTMPVAMNIGSQSDCSYAIVDPPGTSESDFLIDGLSFTTNGDPSPPYIELIGADREVTIDWGVAANSLDGSISDCETANYRYIIGVAGNEIIDVNAATTELAIFPYEQFQIVGYQDAFNTGVYNSNGGAVTNFGDGTWYIQGKYNPQLDDSVVGQQAGYTWYTIDPSLSEVGMWIQASTSGTVGLIFGIIRYFENDTDCDGIANHLDLDSDNDGIPDAVEACGDISLTLEDCMLDNNGDETYIFDPVNGCSTGVIVGSCTQPIDTDGDGIPDYMDLDSDNDGCNDATEARTDGFPGVSGDTYSAGTVDVCGVLLDNGAAQCDIPTSDNWKTSNAQCQTQAQDQDLPDYLDTCSIAPCHLISSDIYLGTGVTAETSPSSNATASIDTDDGVNIFSSLDIVPGGSFRLPVTVYNNTGIDAQLHVWIDWDGNGDFVDTNETIISGTTYATGTHVINIIVPAILNTNQIGLRFRYSTDTSVNANTPCGTGVCAADGEVEDYVIPVNCNIDTCLPVRVNIKRG